MKSLHSQDIKLKNLNKWLLNKNQNKWILNKNQNKWILNNNQNKWLQNKNPNKRLNKKCLKISKRSQNSQQNQTTLSKSRQERTKYKIQSHQMMTLECPISLYLNLWLKMKA